jgi:hypothetical protein
MVYGRVASTELFSCHWAALRLLQRSIAIDEDLPLYGCPGRASEVAQSLRQYICSSGARHQADGVRERYVDLASVVLPKHEAACSVGRSLCSDLADTASRLLCPFIMVYEQGQEELYVSIVDWLSVRRSGQRQARSFCQGALGREDFFCDGVRHSVIATPNVIYFA